MSNNVNKGGVYIPTRQCIVYEGDHVEYQSTCSARIWRGVIEGFLGEARDVAMCTDQTGRKSRPVAVKRLKKVVA